MNVMVKEVQLFCSSYGKISSESINRTPSIKVGRLKTYKSIFKVDRGRKIGKHPQKVDCKVDYPTCGIPLIDLGKVTTENLMIFRTEF